MYWVGFLTGAGWALAFAGLAMFWLHRRQDDAASDERFVAQLNATLPPGWRMVHVNGQFRLEHSDAGLLDDPDHPKFRTARRAVAPRRLDPPTIDFPEGGDR